MIRGKVIDKLHQFAEAKWTGLVTTLIICLMIDLNLVKNLSEN